MHGDIVVVDLLSENNWTTPSSEIAFNSSNAEDGNNKYKIILYQELIQSKNLKRIDLQAPLYQTNLRVELLVC